MSRIAQAPALPEKGTHARRGVVLWTKEELEANDWTAIDMQHAEGWMEHELLLNPQLYDLPGEGDATCLVEAYLYEWDMELRDGGEDAEHPIWDLAVEVINDWHKGEA